MPRSLNFRNTRRKEYSLARKAYALHLIAQPGVTQTDVAKKLDIPRGTIGQWKRRYLDDDEFAEQIDSLIETKQGE